MKYALNGEQTREIDRVTIEKIGIPGMVLMEKAAMGVSYAIEQLYPVTGRIIAVCGYGNNGGDAVAAARILKAAGYSVCLYFVGDAKKITKETRLQKKIARNCGIKTVKKVDYNKYDLIIDGIFGTGLSRVITGDMYKEIEKINASKKQVVAVDIPSGVNSADGQILGIAVQANVTVTFGTVKVGCLLYPGAEYSGKIIHWNIGTELSSLSESPKCFYFDEPASVLMPQRKADSNKGTYGKVLCIAGSKNMSGAAYFAAGAAYRTGAGLVRVVTTEDNREVLQKQLPEAVLTTYKIDEDGRISPDDIDIIKEAVNWASVIIIGPGLGMSTAAAAILNYVIGNVKVPLIVDADGINILARLLDEKCGEKAELSERMKVLSELLPAGTVLTPHKKELSRLTGISMGELSTGMIRVTADCTKNNDLVFVKKDVRTIVSFGESNYINVTGNDGMATAGSGDVLGGIIAGIIAQGELPRSAAMTGVYVHGCAGDVAAARLGTRSMLASDIMEAIPSVVELNSVK